jgi:hypothetical protein
MLATLTESELIALFTAFGFVWGYLTHRFTYRLDNTPKSQRPYDWEQDEF